MCVKDRVSKSLQIIHLFIYSFIVLLTVSNAKPKSDHKSHYNNNINQQSSVSAVHFKSITHNTVHTIRSLCFSIFHFPEFIYKCLCAVTHSRLWSTKPHIPLVRTLACCQVSCLHTQWLYVRFGKDTVGDICSCLCLYLSLSSVPSRSGRPTFQHFQRCASEICFQGNWGTKYSPWVSRWCTLCLHFSYHCWACGLLQTDKVVGRKAQSVKTNQGALCIHSSVLPPRFLV